MIASVATLSLTDQKKALVDQMAEVARSLKGLASAKEMIASGKQKLFPLLDQFEAITKKQATDSKLSAILSEQNKLVDNVGGYVHEHLRFSATVESARALVDDMLALLIGKKSFFGRFFGSGQTTLSELLETENAIVRTG